MGRITNKTQVVRKYADQLRKMREQHADEIVALTYDRYLGGLPVAEQNSGHLFEAAITAAQKIAKRFPRLAQSLSRYEFYRSGDPKAVAAGSGRVLDNRKRLHMEFIIDLPFAATVEYGGTLGTIAPKGKKDPAAYGVLYGPRYAGRNGMLMWVDDSGVHLAKFRTLSGRSDGVGVLRAAMEAADSRAQALGWRRV